MLRLTCKSLLAGLVLAVAACYDPEHFSVPGPYLDADDIKDPDTVPYVFSGENLVYLVRDGEADYTRLSLLGFTDFAPEVGGETLSWGSFTDHNGRKCLRCRQHRNFYAADDKDHFGGNKYSFEFNELASRIFLENGPDRKWRVYARMALSSFGNESRPMFSFEGEKGWSGRGAVGLDFVNYFIAYRDENLLTGWYNPRTHMASSRYSSNMLACADFVVPGEVFEFDLQRVDNMFYLSINGKMVWMKAIPADKPHVFPLIFRPWMNEVCFYDLCIEGDYQWWKPLGVQQEDGYMSIQAPALAAAGDGLVLFAEGHREFPALMHLDENSRRTNATDIIMNTSSDAGENWEGWKVVKGGDGSVSSGPEVIQDGNRLMLFYTVDLNGRQNGDTRIEYMVSEDGGKNWGNARVLPLGLEDYELRTLPGKGLRISDGSLHLPLECRIGRRGTVAVARYDGKDWSLGRPVEGLRNGSADLVERPDGVLEMYLGYSGGGTYRRVVRSRDRGLSWSAPEAAGMPVGDGGQMSPGAVLQTADGRLLHFTATGAVKASSFAGHDCSYPNQSYEAKSRKELYVFNPPMDYMMQGMAFTMQGADGTWSPLEDLWPLDAAYTGYVFKTGSMDAVVVGNRAVAVAEAGVRVPYEGLVIFRKSW